MADALPLNVIAIWTGGACPSGYTRFLALDGRFLTSNTPYNAAAGGSSSHSHADMVSHNHSILFDTASASTGTNGVFDGDDAVPSASANVIHSHSISGTSANAIVSAPSQSEVQPAYATVVLCQRTS